MENDLLLARKNKLDYIIENHINPYPDRFDVNKQIKDAPRLPDGTENICIAGRIILMVKWEIFLLQGSVMFKEVSKSQ